MKTIFLLILFLLNSVIYSQTRTTEEVYNHHEQAFLSQDINSLMEDYDENSLLITPDGKVHKGTDEIRKTFEYAFAELFPPESNLDIIHKVIEEDIAYLVYAASNAATGKEYWNFATDTFIIKNGIISHQTVAAKMPENLLSLNNKQVLRRYFEEAWNNKKYDLISEVTPEVFTLHFGGDTIEANKEQHKEVVKYWTTVFPDYNVEIQDMVAEGDKVAVNYVFTGTQKQKIEDIEPTNKKVEVSGIWICTFENGLITECWEEYDVQGMLDQLQSE